MSNVKITRGKILFQLSGSIACFKACALLSKLVQEGFDVEVVASAGALKFIGEATLEGLVGKPIHTDLYARGDAMSHIHLARWADLIVLCPASANTISKFAHGIGDDLLSTLFLAHDFKRPYLIAPAMNGSMYKHPATQASLQILREFGVMVLEPSAGSLACGEIGEGRLLEPDELFAIIIKAFSDLATTKGQAVSTRPPNGARILITSGGTREAIDGVRSITNFSTGATGASLADFLSSNGWQVTLLAAESSILPQNPEIEIKSYVSYSDLSTLLEKELKSSSYAAILQAAAIADYSVDFIQSGNTKFKPGTVEKFDSREPFNIQMKNNPRLIDHIREWSRNSSIRVIAFKLTNTEIEKSQTDAVTLLAGRAHPDLIVQNDLRNVSPVRHIANVYEPKNKKVDRIAQAHNKLELGEVLNRWLSAHALKTPEVTK
jgi:phosphopantothenoylcysteine decarboxylase/phosphopantothenate--cysteine ligase